MEIIGNSTLYHCDCKDILPTLKDVDAVVTDPPYNISALGGGGLGKNAMYSTDKISAWCNFDVSFYIPMVLNTQKVVNGFFFCSRLGLSKYLGLAESLNHDLLVWHKTNAIPFTNGTMKQDLEYIVRLYEKNALLVKGMHHSQYSKLFQSNIDSSRNKEHPTKKPLFIIERLCALISNEGDTVLDPFMGSGTTGVACNKLKRKFIGIEKEQKYFDIACERIEKAQKQLDMGL